MKKKIVMLLFVVVVGILCSKNILQSHSLTPPVGNTGAPGETTCAQAGCHGGSGTGGVACTDSLIISSKYLGQQYRGTGIPTNLKYVYTLAGNSNGYGVAIDTLTFTIKLPSAPIAGFQMSATAGSFMIVDTNTTQISVSAGKQYISHKNSTNGSNTWKFKWYPTSATLPMFYFSTVCDTASISGGSGGGGGGSCVPGCTGSSTSGAFGATIGTPCNTSPSILRPIINLFSNGTTSGSSSNTHGFCVGDTIYLDYIELGNTHVNFFFITPSSAPISFIRNYGTHGFLVKCMQAGSCNAHLNYFSSCIIPLASTNSPFSVQYNTDEQFVIFDKPQPLNFINKFNCLSFNDTIGIINGTPSLYDYTWTPTFCLNSSTVYNPVATITSTTTFILTQSYKPVNTFISDYIINSGIGGSFSFQTNSPSYCVTKDTQTIYLLQPTSAPPTTTTICKNESYLFNGNAYSSAGTFMDTLVNYNGCDSITTLNLNVRTDEPISISGTICKSGRFIFNGKTYNASGTFTDTIFSTTSCDTVYTLTLSTAVIPVDTSVTVSNEMLIAHATNATFQWYDCAVHNLIQGAVDDTLLPFESGYYSVIVTTQPEHCIDTSACKFIFVSGINAVDELQKTKLYPNPINNELHIQFSKNITNGTIKLFAINGSEVMTQLINNQSQTIISTKNIANGIYWVEVISGNSVWHQKVVKQ